MFAVLVTCVATVSISAQLLPEDSDPYLLEEYLDDPMLPEKRSPIDKEMCLPVCDFCRRLISMRWVALCYMQCKTSKQGRGFEACMMLWNLQKEFDYFKDYKQAAVSLADSEERI